MADRPTTTRPSAQAETIDTAGVAGVRLPPPAVSSQTGSALVYVLGIAAFALVVLPALMFATRVFAHVTEVMGR